MCVCVCVCVNLAHPPNMAKVSSSSGAPARCDRAWGLKGSYWFNSTPRDTSCHSPKEQSNQSDYSHYQFHLSDYSHHQADQSHHSHKLQIALQTDQSDYTITKPANHITATIKPTNCIAAATKLTNQITATKPTNEITACVPNIYQ